MYSPGSGTPLTKRCATCGRIYQYNETHSCPGGGGPRSDPFVSSNEQAADPEDPMIGAVLGDRYLMQTRLSRGGMGVVYKARHKLLETAVAVKILLEQKDQVAQLRFLQEAKLASKIRHPNTVFISDFGVLADGRSYLVMELLRGPTLSKVQRKGPMDPLRVCRIGAQIAVGVQAIHDLGIVHRDLKPDNVFLVEQDGTPDHVKIVDFGIAVRVEAPRTPLPEGISRPSISRPSMPATGNERFTMSGAVMGTPHYMSPEQIEGSDLDARSDQYALGCILYEMLTGTVPFDASSSHAILVKHMTMPVAPMRERLPTLRISRALETIINRLLAKEKKDRFASMREAAEALEREADVLAVQRGEKVVLPSNTVVAGRLRARSGLVVRGRRISLWLVLPIAGALLAAGGYLGVRRLVRPPPVTAQLPPIDVAAIKKGALTVVSSALADPQPALRGTAIAGLVQTHDAGLGALVRPLLRDADPDVRAQAAAALGRLGERAALRELAELTREAEPVQLRVAAAGALWQLGEASGETVLRGLLDGKDAVARQKAAFLLCESGEPQALALLRQIAEIPALSEDQVLTILGRLAQSGDAAAREKLLTRLRAPGRPVQLLVAAKLAQLGEAQGLERLRAMTTEAGPEQLLAARFLAPIEPAVSLPLLRRVARDTGATAPARLAALEGLSQSGEHEDLRIVQPLLASGTEVTLQRGAAFAALGILAREPAALSEQGLAWARLAAADQDWALRASAALVLGDSNAAQARKLLASLAHDPDARVRRNAMQALAQRTDRDALDALHAGVEDSDVKVRVEALRALIGVGQALKKLGSPELIREVSGWLTARLSSGTPPEQALAAAAMLMMGDAEQRARLRALLASTSAEARRIAAEFWDGDLDALASLLSDPVLSVRFMAARRLAEQGDKRGVSVLKEILEQGGGTARLAYALLLKLGEKPALPSDSDVLWSSGSVDQRLQALESVSGLPSAQQAALLNRAARDRDASVRMQAAEVAAKLGDTKLATSILRILGQDADAAVRARAGTLLSQLGGAQAPAPAAESKPAESAPPTVLPALPAATGTTEPAVPPPATPDKPQPTLAEQLAANGVQLLERKDFAHAQQLLERARKLCAKDKRSASCAELGLNLSFHLGRTYEAQGQLAEAMTEFERVVKASAGGRDKGRAAQLSTAQEAVLRLVPKLGVVVIKRRGASGCQQTSRWMPPGTHQIEVDGAQQEVNVQPTQTVQVGSCP